MSAQSIQKKISNAHKKVGNKLGYTYGIYRPLNSNVDIISDRNLIKYVKAATTLNDSFTSNVKWEVPIWTLYSETGVLKPGDYLYSEEEGRTFFVLIMQPHQPVLAVEANDRINLTKVGYGDAGTGFAPVTEQYIARNLPCYLTYGSGSVASDLPGNGVGNIPYRTMTVYTAIPQPDMLLGETLADFNGFKGDITSYDFNSVGVGVKLTVAERGFPNA